MTMTSLVAAAMLSLIPLSQPHPIRTAQTPDPAASAQAGPTVTLDQGLLAGRRQGEVAGYLNIPYAAPPVGAMRWRPPGPAPSWEGERDATRPGPLCVQPPSGGDPGVGPGPVSEDCLQLNVWTPEGRGAALGEGPLPVMVWIHGGGFNNGSGTAALYDGAALARRGVVVVTVNYRLGRLGFFDHPALAAERAEGEAGGNYAMMDIVAALGWVRDNAEAFGGDAGNVTVFGESAGGAAVTRLMISPVARGLFHRAVVQSGLGRDEGTPLDRPSVSGRPSMQDRGAAWAEAAGVEGTAEALRAVPAEALLRPAPNFYGGDNLVIDGVVVTEDVEAAFAAGRQAPVPFLIGTNSAEFWWIKPTEISPYGAMDDAMTSDERVAFHAAYGGLEGYQAHVVSDMAFNEPARHLARLHARVGHPTWLYRFDVVPTPNPEPQHEGATHASERPYVFDNLATSNWPMGDRDQRAASAMADYWTAFAKTGDPNGGGHPDWPAFEADRLLEFTNDGPVAKAMPFGERLDLIEAYYARVR